MNVETGEIKQESELTPEEKASGKFKPLTIWCQGEKAMTQFPVWDDPTCGGCGEPQDEEDEDEPSYRFECADPPCYYEGCHECMPLGRGSRCPECTDPETGE